MSLYLSLMSCSPLVYILNGDTSTLCCLSNIRLFDVEGSSVSPEGVVGLLISLSVLVAPTISSVNSYSETGFNLFLLTRLVCTYVCVVAFPEVVSSSLFLLRPSSTFRGVCKVGSVLMIGSGILFWFNSSNRPGFFYSSCTWDTSFVCDSLCACDSSWTWDSL